MVRKQPIELNDAQDLSADEYTMPKDSDYVTTPEQQPTTKMEQKTTSLLPKVFHMTSEKDIQTAEIYVDNKLPAINISELRQNSINIQNHQGSSSSIMSKVEKSGSVYPIVSVYEDFSAKGMRKGSKIVELNESRFSSGRIDEF